MNWRSTLLSLSLALLSVACSPTDDGPQQTADIIFVGNNIITMDESTVEAVAVVGDRISATGSRDEILAMRSQSTRIVELGEHALLPGFIDAHGHFVYVGLLADSVNLSSPPVGPVGNIDDIVSSLRDQIEDQDIPAGDWVFGYGYDDSLIAENRHPDREDLDRVSTEHPIVITHVSGHLATGNSAALLAAGVNSDSEDPEGGVIRRQPGTEIPNGVMEETAMNFYPSVTDGMSSQRKQELLRTALNIHAGYGLTTVQDGGASPMIIEMMQSEAESIPFSIDVVSYPWINSLDDAALSNIVHRQDYSNGFRIGGVKFGLDGSPQGRTAWLTIPYKEGPPGESEDYVAYATYDADSYNARMKRLLARGVPVLAHANGDAAIDMMIDGVAAAVEGGKITDHRSVVIHGQLMRADQLDRVKELGIVPSYYAAHPYFWGDWHRLSFGDERASFISPLRATLDRGIPFTIHNDSPIVPPDIMRLIWIAVNRKTRSGYVLGPDQRLTVLEALYAVTQGAAYQYFEENEKGSITPGKRADLVILGVNPLKVEPDAIKDIPVLETIARGQTVYRQE
jgi:predicted amidohydrolase YtcJ